MFLCDTAQVFLGVVFIALFGFLQESRQAHISDLSIFYQLAKYYQV